MNQYSLDRPAELGKLVVIGGPGATGSSTIAMILAQKWGLHRVYGGEIMRNNNHSGELSSYLINRVSKNPKIDTDIDQFLVKISYYPNILIESKAFAAIATTMGISCSLKLWVISDITTRVQHFLEREGRIDEQNVVSPKSESFKKIRDDILKRQANDISRYNKLYRVDLTKPEQYNDIIIDTTKLNIPSTIRKIFTEIKHNDSLRKRFSPKDLRY